MVIDQFASLRAGEAGGILLERVCCKLDGIDRADFHTVLASSVHSSLYSTIRERDVWQHLGQAKRLKAAIVDGVSLKSRELLFIGLTYDLPYYMLADSRHIMSSDRRRFLGDELVTRSHSAPIDAQRGVIVARWLDLGALLN